LKGEIIMEMKVRLTLTEEALGMMPANKELHETYIASKAPDAPKIEEEIAAVGVGEVVEKTMTVFPKLEDGTPFFWDYQIRGMFKDSIGMLRRIKDKKCSKLTSYKKVVDGLIFVNERKIPIHLSGPMGNCQRPLRADTMQGPRVALAHSESGPAGSTLEFTINLLDDSLEDVIRECLDYGKLRGLGQWRNSGCGRFVWEEVAA
jgi:hypothetical protein